MFDRLSGYMGLFDESSVNQYNPGGSKYNRKSLIMILQQLSIAHGHFYTWFKFDPNDFIREVNNPPGTDIKFDIKLNSNFRGSDKLPLDKYENALQTLLSIKNLYDDDYNKRVNRNSGGGCALI